MNSKPYEDDPAYIAAVELVRKTGRASISTVQRHLMIGYNHAARLVEAMEQNGIISTPDAAGARHVLRQKQSEQRG